MLGAASAVARRTFHSSGRSVDVRLSVRVSLIPTALNASQIYRCRVAAVAAAAAAAAAASDSPGYSSTTTGNPRHNWSATGHPDNRSAAGDPVRTVRDSSLVTSHQTAAAAASLEGCRDLMVGWPQPEKVTATCRMRSSDVSDRQLHTMNGPSLICQTTQTASSSRLRHLHRLRSNASPLPHSTDAACSHSSSSSFIVSSTVKDISYCTMTMKPNIKTWVFLQPPKLLVHSREKTS